MGMVQNWARWGLGSFFFFFLEKSVKHWNRLNNILYILVSPELIQAVELVKEDMGLLEAMDMIRELEYLSYDNRLREFGKLEKRRLWENLTEYFST